jgi:hypothetical protein
VVSSTCEENHIEIFSADICSGFIASDDCMQKYNPLGFDTGNDIYSACTSQDTTFMVACRSFISGVTMGYGVPSDAEKTIHIPNEV